MILAVEEACSNVIRHAYENGHARPLSLKIETTPKQIKVLLRDVGKPFDFDSYPSEITAQQALVARARGGYGVHLIKSLMDEYSYVRSEKGENHLQLIKNFKEIVTL